MSEVIVRERYLKNGKKVYEYCFELAHEGGKRRRRTKSGFATKREARAAGRQAFITDLYNDGFSVNTVTSIKGLLTKPIYQDVCYPVTKDFREKLYNEIISEYEKAKDKSNEKARESAEKHHGNPDKEKDKEATPFR